MSGKLRDEHLDRLFDAILSLKTRDECCDFFEDLCTIGELLDMKQRFHVVRMLNRGCSYNEIVQATGASTATISRVNRALEYGKDGYKLVLSRLDKL